MPSRQQVAYVSRLWLVQSQICCSCDHDTDGVEFEYAVWGILSGGETLWGGAVGGARKKT